jgi:PPOX class probable F420-dependent enzyme
VTAALGDDARRLLDGANFGHLSTLMADGSPKVEPVWVAREGDCVLVTTDGRSIKAQNIERDPRVALSVTAFDDPYDQLLIRGRVVEVRPDDDLAVLDGFSEKYLGTPFARRRWSRRVVLVVEADLARSYHSPLRDPRTPDQGQPPMQERPR